MRTRLTTSFMMLVLLAGAVQAQEPAKNPNAELISQLSTTLGATPEQATGAAGAIFAAAKAKMDTAQWSKVAASIPEVDSMMHVVPVRADAGPSAKAQAEYGIRGVSSLSGAFTGLGLQPVQIGSAAKVVSEYVSKMAGYEVGNSFAAALQQ